MKIRVISKGPPITYFVLKPFQKHLWKCLQRFDLFELTGTPVSEGLVDKKFGRCGKFFSTDNCYHSGDLDSATDKMESWFSEDIANEIFDLYEEESGFSWAPFRELFIRALTRHLISDPELCNQPNPFGAVECLTRAIKPQTIGQLMGSIISFPILCIGNAAASRFSLEVTTGKRVSLRNYPGWINGDDVATAYPVGLEFDKNWERVMGFFGFNKSIGKCYDSPNFFNINSTTYCRQPSGNWSLVRYVNLGLLTGQKRSVSEKSEKSNLFEIAICQNELWETCPPHLREALLTEVISRHFESLSAVDVPWFLPVWAGGLGFRCKSSHISNYDNKIYHATMYLLATTSMKCPKYTGSKDWQLFDLWTETVRSHGVVGQYPYEECEDGEDGLTAHTYFFWKCCGLSDLYNPHKSEWRRTLNECRCVNNKAKKLIATSNKSFFDPEINTEVESKASVFAVVESY